MELSLEHEPQAVVESLAACDQPWLIGVRHHSAALARSLETLLEQMAPTTVLVEMPSDLGPWREYLGDAETEAPVAISAVDANGSLGFYPLADFSPEWVAIRWAMRRGIPVIPCDLSVSARVDEAVLESFDKPSSNSGHPGLLESLLRRTQSSDTGQLWERLVESPSMSLNPEESRRAALLFGWAVRTDAEEIPQRDLVREVVMRQAVRQAPPGSVAIVGAFHAPALTPTAILQHAEQDSLVLTQLTTQPEAVGVSLVPYGFEQLDERSGYPAGIRDPVWHQRMFQATSAQAMDAAAVELVVNICRAMRRRGHVAGTPDASEVVRMMRNLARLRRLPTAGRSELHEAMQTCLTHGELNGRAREVAKAAEQILVGRRQGRVSARTPRCGLALSIEQLLNDLGLPGSGQVSTKLDDLRELRLDVLRSVRDRAKAVVLRRLAILGVPYAERVDSLAIGERENLGERWKVGWRQGTSATVESVARFGVTLSQAVAGTLRFRFRGNSGGGTESGGDESTPAELLERLELAAESGIVEMLSADLAALGGEFLKTAGLTQLVQAFTIWGRINAGHIAALPQNDADAYPPIMIRFDPSPYNHTPAFLLEAALHRLDGVAGSDQRDDIIGVCDLAQSIYESAPQSADRLLTWCRRSLQSGADEMRGTAAGILALFQQLDQEQLATLVGGWFDQGVNKDGRKQLRGRMLGLAQVLFPQMLSDPHWLTGLETRLRDSGDADFLQRLPALRGAFHEFSPADRQRLLRIRLELYADRGLGLQLDELQQQNLPDAGLWIATLRDSDLQGRQAIKEVLPDFQFEVATQVTTARVAAEQPVLAASSVDAISGDRQPPEETPQHNANASHSIEQQIPLADRWRMILGIPPESPQPLCRAATRLDDLYGRGKGEGARQQLGNRGSSTGSRGGDEAPQPSLLEWADDLEQLFGSDVCQEVFGDAVEQGHVAAVQLLDPDRVTPSVDLLRQVLSLAGGLPEERAEKLRQLARRITAALAQQLAIRLQPALHGLASPRPTRRHGRKLHLHRTIRDNLTNVYRRRNGKPSVIAKRLVFHSTSRREMDWHLTFVVDVSGSMSTSVIYSAICAAVFSELPALSVKFLAFSTEVIDLSDKVADPLSLLLEVQVGGGTRIGLGLAAARATIQVPQRTLLVLVSDFEEGVSLGEMLAEIRELAASGVRCLGLAAIDDSGIARFHQGYASMAAAAGMSVAAVAPEQLARWVGDQIRGHAGGTTSPKPEALV